MTEEHEVANKLKIPDNITQLAFTCSELAIEILEQAIK